MGRPVAAMADGEFAVQQNPNSAKGFLIRGQARAALGDFLKAYEDIEQGFSLSL
jgi:hypothetical protein